MGKPLSVIYDPQAGASYIALSAEPAVETVEIESTTLASLVILDLDGTGRPTGVELIGPAGQTSEDYFAFISEGSLGAVLVNAGFKIRKLLDLPITLAVKIRS